MKLDIGINITFIVIRATLHTPRRAPKGFIMRARRVIPALLLGALSLTACGGGDEAAGGEKATGEPIVVGGQAPSKGAAAFPQSEDGLKAGEWYVNNVLGGIDGRPLEIDVCQGDGSPETAINCANGFASSGVPLVLDAYDLSIGGAVPILGDAGVPIIGTLAGTPVPDAAPYGDAFYFSGPTALSALGSMTVLEKLGKEDLSLGVTDAPSTHAYVDTLMKPIAEALGMNLDASYISSTGANFNVVAATQLSDDPDVTGIMALPEDGCTSLFQALRQQGYDGTIFAGSCSQFIEQMGSGAAGAIVQPRLWVPLTYDNAPADVQEDLDAFTEAMEAIDKGDQLSARSLYSFALVMNLVDVLETIDGDITPDTVRTAMQSLVDFPTFAGPEVTCDGEQWPGLPSSCSREAIFFEVQDDGTLAPVDEDEVWTELDPAVIPTS